MSEKEIPNNTSSRPTDGQEGRINGIKIFSIYYNRLKIMCKTYVGLKNE